MRQPGKTFSLQYILHSRESGRHQPRATPVHQCVPLHVGSGHATSRAPTHVSAFPLLQTPLTVCSKPRKLLQRDGLPPIEARDKTGILDQLSMFLLDQPQDRPRKEGIFHQTGGEGRTRV